MSRVNLWREKCYANVPHELYLGLKQFRMQYPYKKMMIGKQEWQYIITDGGPRVLLMLPGSTTTAESNWREIVRLALYFRVISISYPPVKSTESLFEGIIKILDTERLEQVDIFGASMGGAIAHWLIRHYPQRVNRLILLSIGLPDSNTAEQLKKAVYLFSIIPNMVIRKLFEKEAEKLVSVLPENEAKLMTAYFKDLYRNDMNKRTIIAHFRLVAQIAENVKSLGLDKPYIGTNPVLIIYAADDESFSEESKKAFIATYPNTRTFIFQSGGHTLFSRREELNSVIDDFLQKEEVRKDSNYLQLG